MKRHLTLYHAPYSRSSGVLVLLEELNADYQLEVLHLKTGEQRQSAYLAINPMGKVPALRHGDALVTEQVAIYLYLADLYPEAALAPPLGDPQRGPYLRWLAFYGSCFEPAIVDLSMQRAPAQASMCPYGDYDIMLGTLTAQLARGPYLLGEVLSAADVLWATSLTWASAYGLVPKLPLITDYMGRIAARPALLAAAEKDAALAAGLAAAQ